MGDVDQDRRRAPRVELRAEGVVDLGDHTIPCQILDVSNGGLALLVGEPAPLRAIRVRFQLGRAAAWTEVEGQVVRSHAPSDGSLDRLSDPEGAEFQLRRSVKTIWGLRFGSLDLGTRTRLRGYVAHQLRS